MDNPKPRVKTLGTSCVCAHDHSLLAIVRLGCVQHNKNNDDNDNDNNDDNNNNSNNDDSNNSNNSNSKSNNDNDEKMAYVAGAARNGMAGALAARRRASPGSSSAACIRTRPTMRLSCSEHFSAYAARPLEPPVRIASVTSRVQYTCRAG
eukprot:361997-Chlamydomonas_euryale.AAC.1